MKTNRKSKCCNADIRVAGIGDFYDKDISQTRYFVCTKCDEPCDLKED